LDGRGVTRDSNKGLDLLLRGCEGGFALACAVGAHWLGESADADSDQEPSADLRARFEMQHACLTGQGDACYQVGFSFYLGRDGYPRDRGRAVRAYSRGCDLDDSRACNNLGDALTYGEGTGRDLALASALFDKACHLGEALGCANLGYMLEHGSGVVSDAARARRLYGDACATGEPYGCLHAEMLAVEGAPGDSAHSVARWRRACEEQRSAQGCAFLGLLYEDGPDGLARDEAKSQKAMVRACELGNIRACEWVKQHGEP
jgi:TPR repeat protein